MLPSNQSRIIINPACRSVNHHHIHSITPERSSFIVTRSLFQRRPVSLKSGRLYHRPQVSATSIAVTWHRHRSNWARDMRSFWHRPDCTWVHSEGDPRTTPRDKECPACQYDAKRPTELSVRELTWERRMELMKQCLEKDPYNALFGRSNERLKWLFGRADEDWKMPWFGRRTSGLGWRTFGQSNSKVQGQAEKNAATEQKHASAQTNVTAAGNDTSPIQIPTSGKPFSSEREDESVFDPISMRRIPREPPKQSAMEPLGSKDRSIAVESPVKTFTVPTPNRPPATALQSQSNATCHGVSQAQPVIASATPLSTSLGAQPTTSNTRVSDFWLSSSKASSLSSMTESKNSMADIAGRSVNAKATLEASWIKEREARQKSFKAKVDEAVAMKEHELRQYLDNVNSRVLTSAHFTRGGATNDIAAHKICYISNHKRDRPFKHMSANDIGAHRASLIAAWSKRSQLKPTSESPPVETPAEKLLSAEVNAQKTAMHNFEIKARPFGPLRGGTDPVIFQNEAYTETPTSTKPSREVLAEQEEAADSALIREIKNIYEKSYGRIGAIVKEEAVKTSLQEYERDLPPWQYDLVMGQDGLEQELREPAKTLKSGYEEPTYYDKSLGVSPYTFKMGEDNLEAELKAQSKRSVVESTIPSIGAETAKPELLNLPEPLGNLQSLATDHTPRNGKDRSSLRAMDAIDVPNNKPSGVDRQLYQIIAYDAKDRSIHTATASTSFNPPTGTVVLPLETALMRLDKPAKFLPYIEKYQSKGYEIVSTSDKLLVMKRLQHVNAPNEAVISTEAVPSSFAMQTMVEKQGVTGLNTEGPELVAEPDSRVFAEQTLPLNTALESPSQAHQVRKTQHVRKEEPIFSGTQRRWDGATVASSITTHAAGVVVPMQQQQQQQSNESGANASSDTSSSRRYFIARAITKVAIIFGACYITGCWIELLREQNVPGGGNGRGVSAAKGSHSSYASFAPGVTDRAMWKSNPRDDKGRDVSQPVASDRDNNRQGSNWSRTWAWESKNGAKVFAKVDEKDIDAVTWVGTALCVLSAVGLLRNLFHGGN